MNFPTVYFITDEVLIGPRLRGIEFTHQHKTLLKIQVQLLPVVFVQFHFKVAGNGDHG